MADIKCRKCRRILFGDSLLVTNHSQSYGTGVATDQCSQRSNVYYLSQELLTDWMVGQLDAAEWTKGKLYCPNPDCQSRVGSFNFVNGSKCTCDEHVLPAVHVIRSKVDRPLHLEANR